MKAIENAHDTRIAQSSAPNLTLTSAKRIQILAMTAIEDRASIEIHIATTWSLRDWVGPDDTGIEGAESAMFDWGKYTKIKECKCTLDRKRGDQKS
jgi:hypothetical protein